jgi:hypothetical protein
MLKHGENIMKDLNVNGRQTAKKASVKYDKVFDGQFPGEVIVTLTTSQGKITAILPFSSVDKETNSINVYLIDEQEDQFLVDLPTYTFTSGSRAWFPKTSVTLKETG